MLETKNKPPSENGLLLELESLLLPPENGLLSPFSFEFLGVLCVQFCFGCYQEMLSVSWIAPERLHFRGKRRGKKENDVFIANFQVMEITTFFTV